MRPAYWQKGPGSDCHIGLTEPCYEQRQQGFINLGMYLGEAMKIGAADKTQDSGANSHHVAGTWRSVDDRHLTNDCARSEKGEDAFLLGVRHHRDFKQPLIDTVTAFAGIADKKQHLAGLEPHRGRTAKKLREKMFRQARQQALICRACIIFWPGALSQH